MIRMVTSGMGTRTMCMTVILIVLLTRRYPYGTSEESDTVVLLHDAFQNLTCVLP